MVHTCAVFSVIGVFEEKCKGKCGCSGIKNERLWGMEKICNSSAFIFCIHKPASKLSVAAMQLMFIHYGNERQCGMEKTCNSSASHLLHS